MDIIFLVIALICGVGIGLLVNYLIAKSKGDAMLKKAKEDAENLKKAKLLEVKEKFINLKADYEKEVAEREQKFRQIENQHNQKEQTIKQKYQELNHKNQELQNQTKKLDAVRENLNSQITIVENKKKELEKIKFQEVEKLSQISGLSAEQAKAQLVESIRDEAKTEAMAYVSEMMEEAKMTANKEAKRIVIQTIQRVATETAIENSITVFHIDSDELKGRIIGREGRNIRALEAATGVEFIVDDTPEAIVLSGFDPVRREVARLSLHQLVTDGRIHPARIEEVVAKTRKQIEEEIAEVGKRTTIDLGVHGLHPDLIRLVGKMKYRSSYGQNLLQHSREVANLCAIMAAELGLNPQKAKRAGLLHDIGKVPDDQRNIRYEPRREVQRETRCMQCYRCSPRRSGDDLVACPDSTGLRCYLGGSPWGSSRNHRGLCKTSQRLGKSGYELRRRGEDLRHTGRSRATGDSRGRQDRRYGYRKTLVRYCKEDTGYDDLSGTGENHRYPRDTLGELRQVVQNDKRFSI